MKLIFINGPYGYARDIKAMEIFRNAVDNAGWLDEKDSLVSGDMVGFNFGDDEVRATVETGKEIIEVHMISPLKYMLGVVVKAYNEFENRVEHLRYRKISKPERIKTIIERTPGKITKKEISQTCPDISLTTIERTLSDLLAAGYVEKTGTGRATAYVKK